MKLNYEKLGLKSGIEIHQQLDTARKLFCNCKSRLSQDAPLRIIDRKMRAVAGELGAVDVAAAREALKNKVFHYSIYPEETCSVCTDSEPPHPMNMEALEIGMKIALMLNCTIPDEIQVMRKTVIDGSNTSGFQRTALVGMDGWVDTKFGKVVITDIMIEEDAAKIIKRNTADVHYSLDRLGIPLVEIGTAPDCRHPEQVKELAEKIGMILKSTGKVKTGLGKIRQDVNVSIKGGTRIELKGVQSLSIIPEAVDREIMRQQLYVDKKEKVTPEVRKCLPDGRSEFMRPMGGGHRLYPETDIPPIRIDRVWLDQLRLQLPELLEDRTSRYIAEYNLSPDIAKQLASSGRMGLFEYLVEWADPKTLATTLTSTLTQVRREGADISKLDKNHFREIFRALKRGEIAREAIPELLKEMANRPREKFQEILKAAAGGTVSESDLKLIVKKVVDSKPGLLKTGRPEKVYMGLVMKEVRGRFPGGKVMKAVAEEIKRRK
ncbi:MAG: Glu-tRNA(Gln) amidotransferase subunit GatE [Candidatus Aenigmarchaeota archaeon]